MFPTFKWKLKTRFHYVLWLPLGNLLGCLSLKYLRKNFLFCMRFSRYILILEHILLWSVNNSNSETHQVFSVSHYSAAWALGKQVFLVQDILRISCLACLACFFSSKLEKASQPIQRLLSELLSGDGEIRTLDPLLARQVLSQLSYTPIWSGSHLLSHAVSSKVPSAA